MCNNKPSPADLPSATQLVKSTIFACMLAMIILLVAVLPAEYGIDPLGAGKVLGLTRMGEIKTSLAREAAAETAAVPGATTGAPEPVAAAASVKVVAAGSPLMTDRISLTLAPDEAREVKVKMLKGGKVSYKWTSNAGRANFDVHGDSKKLNINYFNYSKGAAVSDSGVLEAEFDGKHGWFWRNRSGKPMTITLEVEGEFTEMTREV